jgi:hypothetical protein
VQNYTQFQFILSANIQTNFLSIFDVQKWSFIVGKIYISSSPQTQFGKKQK